MSKRRVVIVGASVDRSKYGNKSVRAHRHQGWEVVPINPRGGTIEGLPVLQTLAEVTGFVDRVSMYVPPEIGIELLPEIAAISPAEFFLNPGSESDALVERAQELGLDPLVACSIVDLGVSPSQFG